MIDVIVTIEHVRKLERPGGRGLCSRGVNSWMQRHGFDYMHFLQHGILASKVEATGDAFGLRIVEIAREELKDQS